FRSSGVVFEDFSTNPATTDNGVFDPGENPIANVTLTLAGTDINGQAVEFTVQTGADGSYRFDDLLQSAPGAYTITQTQPAGYIDGRHSAGDAETPGDASVSNIVSGIGLGAGQEAAGYDFGELANVVISGSVYLDRNDDGDRNAGDVGIPGVTIRVVDAGADGIFGTADDSETEVQTDANGDW